jgi:positive phototaxis protein PixI
MTANTTLARLQQLLPQLFEPLEVTGEPYLRFQLTPEIPALLSMERVQEALLVPATAISPLPNLPTFTIGMMNSRDRVFCVVDLGQVLGLPPMSINPREYQIIVIHLGETGDRPIDPGSLATVKCMGLAVRQIRGVVRLEREQLQSIGQDVPECLKPYAVGSFEEPDRQSIVLDAMAIANAPSLLHNPYVQA